MFEEGVTLGLSGGDWGGRRESGDGWESVEVVGVVGVVGVVDCGVVEVFAGVVDF